MNRVLLLMALVLAGAAPAGAWPQDLMQALNRDARRLLPKSLSRLLAEREADVLAEIQRFPPRLGQAMARDLQAGALSRDTAAALDAEASRVADLLREQRVSEGLVRMGGLLRIPADLADPVLSAGAEGYPAGVVREYYAFLSSNLPKIPVVLEDVDALKLPRRELPAYWTGILERSRLQSPVILSELFRDGRVVDHRRIDYRSPVYGVASLSYSRAVTGIAATWLAVWREAHGDVTHAPKQRVVTPKDAAPPVTLPDRSAPPPEEP